jgi:hypothetical protein
MNHGLHVPSTVVLLVLFAGASLPQTGNEEGAKVASHHARFAKLLATSHMRFDSDRMQSIASKIENNQCQLTSDTEPVSADFLPIARSYASEFCLPWLEMWNGVLDACDGDKPPLWCNDERSMLEHLGLDGYFAGLTTALRSASDELERENIMDMVLVTFTAHVVGEFGREPMARWATDAARAYLPKATLEQVTSMVERLQKSWVGLVPGVESQVRGYLEHANGVTEDQRAKLEGLLANRSSKH